MFSLAIPLALLAAANLPAQESVQVDEQPKLAWFAGSYEEALAAATESKRPVFVAFWANSSPWCHKLERETLSDAAVVKATAPFVCLRVDVESESGLELAKRHHVGRLLPTIYVLEPDASVRDVLVGYFPPRAFEAEMRRIASGSRTIIDLRARLEVEPGDLDARFDLAKKLSQIGDAAGAEQQVAAIRERDPEGKARASRKLALDEAARALQQATEKSDARFRELMRNESDPGLLYTGWSWIHRIDAFLATQPGEQAAQYATLAREAARKAWPHCPAAERALFGNDIAWHFYEVRDALDQEEKAFALAVSGEVAELVPTDANALDTYACCLAMNGRREEALAIVKRCIALDPENPSHESRLAELGGS